MFDQTKIPSELASAWEAPTGWEKQRGEIVPTVNQPSNNKTISPSTLRQNSGQASLRVNNLSKKNHHHKILLFLPILILIVSIFTLSVFFFSRQRQPKTQSRASVPSPTVIKQAGDANEGIPSGASPALSPKGDFEAELGTRERQDPRVSSSGFGNLVSPPSSSESSESTSIISNQPTSSSPSASPLSERVVFDITAENNTFTPNQLTAYKGQIVVIYVTAVDKDYDFALPDLSIKKTFKLGTKSSLEFQAQSFGQYTFQCVDYCKDTDTAKGLLTIKP